VVAGETIVAASDVISYLQRTVHDFDADLVDSRADLVCYRSLLKQLFILIDFITTVDEENTVYAQHATWVIRKILRSRRVSSVSQQAATLDVVTTGDAFSAISTILHTFALKLDSAPYLFGQHISSVDIGLSAAVAVMMFSPLRVASSLVYQAYPALAAMAFKVLTRAGLPGFTGTPDLEAISQRNAAQVQTLIQKGRVRQAQCQAAAAAARDVDGVDEDCNFAADETTPVENYAQAAVANAMQAAAPEAPAPVPETPGAKSVTSPFTTVCLGLMFTYYMMVKASRSK
jgi:hypothetical protein